jgi:hypothetical protein
VKSFLDPVDGLQGSIYPLHIETNVTEGSEFLDDAIRTKDQPFDVPEKENQEIKFQTKKIYSYESY